MLWRRSSTDVMVCLPDQRKALAERYTIDADEAQRRGQLANEAEAARQAAEEEAERRAAAQEATRRVAKAEAARRAAEEEAGETPADEHAPAENGELPIHRWFAGR